MSYEKAVASKLHVLPAILQAKVDAGMKLKRGEEQAVNGYVCLEEELKKKPEDRIPQKFTEDYENILKLDDEVSISSGSYCGYLYRDYKRATVRKPPYVRCLPVQTSDVMVGNANEGDGHGHGLKFSPDWNWNIGGTACARKPREHKEAQCSVCGRSGHNKRTCTNERKKKLRHCSLCGMSGHNKKTCAARNELL